MAKTKVTSTWGGKGAAKPVNRDGKGAAVPRKRGPLDFASASDSDSEPEKRTLEGSVKLTAQLILAMLNDCAPTGGLTYTHPLPEDLDVVDRLTFTFAKDGWVAESPDFETIPFCEIDVGKFRLNLRGKRIDEETELTLGDWQVVEGFGRAIIKLIPLLLAASSPTASPLGNLLLRFHSEARATFGKYLTETLEWCIEYVADVTGDKPPRPKKKESYEKFLSLWKAAVFGVLCSDAALDQVLLLARKRKRGVDTASASASVTDADFDADADADADFDTDADADARAGQPPAKVHRGTPAECDSYSPTDFYI